MRLLIGGIILIVLIGAIFLSDRNGYERGFAAHESAAQQVALQRTQDALEARDADLATERQLRHQANQQVEEVREKADRDVALIGAAHARAVSEREVAHQTIAEMSAQKCPEPNKFCAWDCLLPPVRPSS